MSRRRILLANQTQGGGGFSPLDLSPNLWLDATDASTITEVSGDVGQWDDKSGNGNNVVQTLSTDRPTNGASINGNNAIDWGASTNRKRLGLNRGANTDNWQDVYVVGRWDAADTTFPRFNGLYSAFTSGGTAGGVGLVGYPGTPDFYNYRFFDNLYLNEIVISSGDDVLGVANTIANNFLISFSANSPIGVNGICVGGERANNSNGWQGVIGEVVAFPRKLSDTERGQMNTYLTNKWGL